MPEAVSQIEIPSAALLHFAALHVDATLFQSMESHDIRRKAAGAKPVAAQAVDKTGRSVEIDDGESVGRPGDKALQTASKDKVIEPVRYGVFSKKVFLEDVRQGMPKLF